MKSEFYQHESGEWRWQYKPPESPEEKAKRSARNARVFCVVILVICFVLLGQQIWEGKLNYFSVALTVSQIAGALGGLSTNRKIQIAFTTLATVALVIGIAIR